MNRKILIPIVFTLSTAAFVGVVQADDPGDPSHDESAYHWVHDRDEDHPHQGDVQGCVIVSKSNDPEDSPCKILRYEVGNTDTHLLFRWTLATLEFSDEAALADQHIEYRQGFLGTASQNRRIDLNIAVSAEDGWVIDSHPVGLFEKASFEVDRTNARLTAAVPLEAISHIFENGPVPGESINFTRDPSSEASCPLPAVCIPSPTHNILSGSDHLAGATDMDNRTVVLQAYEGS